MPHGSPSPPSPPLPHPAPRPVPVPRRWLLASFLRPRPRALASDPRSGRGGQGVPAGQGRRRRRAEPAHLRGAPSPPLVLSFVRPCCCLLRRALHTHASTSPSHPTRALPIAVPRVAHVALSTHPHRTHTTTRMTRHPSIHALLQVWHLPGLLTDCRLPPAALKEARRRLKTGEWTQATHR